jgi:hypothetical protein
MRCELFLTIKNIFQNPLYTLFKCSYIISLTQLNSKLSIVSLMQHQDFRALVAAITEKNFGREVMDQYYNTDKAVNGLTEKMQ